MSVFMSHPVAGVAEPRPWGPQSIRVSWPTRWTTVSPGFPLSLVKATWEDTKPGCISAPEDWVGTPLPYCHVVAKILFFLQQYGLWGGVYIQLGCCQGNRFESRCRLIHFLRRRHTIKSVLIKTRCRIHQNGREKSHRGGDKPIVSLSTSLQPFTICHSAGPACVGTLIP